MLEKYQEDRIIMKNVEDILNKLYDYYEISGVNELSVKLGVSPQNISDWKARNSINPLKTIIRQNGIYEKIFGESILRNVSDLVDRLMEYYDVTTISELAEKINIGQPAITKWRKNNSINAIKKRCRELGIYDEIFGDFNSNITQVEIIKINNTLLEQAKNEASKFGLDINSYLEHLIIQDLKK